MLGLCCEGKAVQICCVYVVTEQLYKCVTSVPGVKEYLYKCVVYMWSICKNVCVCVVTERLYKSVVSGTDVAEHLYKCVTVFVL